MRLNAGDESWVRECLANFEVDPSDPHAPEIIMLSFGYADLYPDGTVVAYGKVVRESDR